MPWSLDVWNHGLFYWWHPISFCNLKPSEKGTNYITMATSMFIFNMSAPFNTELPPRAYLKHQRKAQKFFNFISKFSAIKTLPSTKPGVFLPRQKPWENGGILGLLPQQKHHVFPQPLPGENPALQVSRLTSKGRAPRVKVLKDAEELKLLGHEVPGGWLCMVVLVGCIGWLVCWMSQNVGCLYGVVLS